MVGRSWSASNGRRILVLDNEACFSKEDTLCQQTVLTNHKQRFRKSGWFRTCSNDCIWRFGMWRSSWRSACVRGLWLSSFGWNLDGLLKICLYSFACFLNRGKRISCRAAQEGHQTSSLTWLEWLQAGMSWDSRSNMQQLPLAPLWLTPQGTVAYGCVLGLTLSLAPNPFWIIELVAFLHHVKLGYIARSNSSATFTNRYIRRSWSTCLDIRAAPRSDVPWCEAATLRMWEDNVVQRSAQTKWNTQIVSLGAMTLELSLTNGFCAEKIKVFMRIGLVDKSCIEGFNYSAGWLLLVYFVLWLIRWLHVPPLHSRSMKHVWPVCFLPPWLIKFRSMCCLCCRFLSFLAHCSACELQASNILKPLQHHVAALLLLLGEFSGGGREHVEVE